jgi:predicted phosphate transport protein (TIGR00153 family)
MGMLKRFFPKQPNFFHQLSRMAEIGLKSAQHLTDLGKESADIETIAKQIGDLEHEADSCFRSSLQSLTDTFITPFEREHLHSLFVTTDDVVDAIHSVAQRALTYRMARVSPLTHDMLNLSVECVQQLQELIRRIDEIKEPTELHRVSKEISRTGNRIEAKMNQSLVTLYDSGAPFSAVLKERDLIMLIQEISNSAERVTTIMETILLDQA